MVTVESSTPCPLSPELAYQSSVLTHLLQSQQVNPLFLYHFQKINKSPDFLAEQQAGKIEPYMRNTLFTWMDKVRTKETLTLLAWKNLPDEASDNPIGIHLRRYFPFKFDDDPRYAPA
jgi:hypothetical protein